MAGFLKNLIYLLALAALLIALARTPPDDLLDMVITLAPLLVVLVGRAG
jgi:hypothetical protein